MEALYGLWFRLNRVYDAMGAADDLPLSQRYALYLLEAGPITQRELRIMTLWPKQTANAVVKALERRGWVELVTREEDRRSKEVRLTEVGMIEAERLNQPIRDAEQQAMASLGEEHRDAMLAALSAYVDAMEGIALEACK